MSLVLFYAPASSAFASIVALEEAGADYEARLVNLAAGEQRSPEFLAVNRHARVPALSVENCIVAENIGVLTYIAARFPDAMLLPHCDALALAKSYELLSWFATGVHIEIAKIFRGERFTESDEAKLSIKQSGIENFGKALEEIETLAAMSGDWLCGKEFSVVDAFGLVIWRWAKRLEIDTANYPAWGRQVASAHDRPAVVRAVSREAAPQLVT